MVWNLKKFNCSPLLSPLFFLRRQRTHVSQKKEPDTSFLLPLSSSSSTVGIWERERDTNSSLSGIQFLIFQESSVAADGQPRAFLNTLPFRICEKWRSVDISCVSFLFCLDFCVSSVMSMFLSFESSLILASSVFFRVFLVLILIWACFRVGF
jgi:hypothetical protein